jgi:hypothetical protein
MGYFKKIHTWTIAYMSSVGLGAFLRIHSKPLSTNSHQPTPFSSKTHYHPPKNHPYQYAPIKPIITQPISSSTPVPQASPMFRVSITRLEVNSIGFHTSDLGNPDPIVPRRYRPTSPATCQRATQYQDVHNHVLELPCHSHMQTCYEPTMIGRHSYSTPP